MVKSAQQIVAVVGCQRSGTTLTGQILGAHPNAVLLDENEGLYPWFRAKLAGGQGLDRKFQAMLARVLKKYRNPWNKFGERGDKLRLLPHITTLVLKAPNLTYDYTALMNFPAPVSIVYPVRDPRSVVASMIRL